MQALATTSFTGKAVAVKAAAPAKQAKAVSVVASAESQSRRAAILTVFTAGVAALSAGSAEAQEIPWKKANSKNYNSSAASMAGYSLESGTKKMGIKGKKKAAIMANVPR